MVGALRDIVRANEARLARQPLSSHDRSKINIKMINVTIILEQEKDWKKWKQMWVNKRKKWNCQLKLIRKFRVEKWKCQWIISLPGSIYLFYLSSLYLSIICLSIYPVVCMCLYTYTLQRINTDNQHIFTFCLVSCGKQKIGKRLKYKESCCTQWNPDPPNLHTWFWLSYSVPFNFHFNWKGALKNKKDDKSSQKLLILGVRKIMFVFAWEEAIKVRLWLKGIRGKAYKAEALKCSME